jgi:hypothetical protein
MTDHPDYPDVSELQRRILDALVMQDQEANYNSAVPSGLSEQMLARQLGVSVEEILEAVQGLEEMGFIGGEPAPIKPPAREIDDPWPSPMPPCQRCGEPADGLDYYCTRCRAIKACDNLCNSLSNALENFLDDRWSPHEFERTRPAYYHTKPAFDGDPEQYLKKIAAAQNQLAEVATRLIRLALPEDLHGRAEAPYKPFFYGPDDFEGFDGIHAMVDWGYAKKSNAAPIECDRVLVGYMKDMVERRNYLLPGETLPPHEIAQPGEPRGEPVMRLTQGGVQKLIDYDTEGEDER